MRAIPKKILIVDDSEIDREVLKNILYDDFDIMEADSGYAALEIILKQKDVLDAILLDISMPVLSGFDVLKLMRENRVTKIPVFLISAEANEGNIKKAAYYNITEFIVKPFDRDEVLKRIRLKLGVITDYSLSDEDVEATYKFISQLEAVYNGYMANYEMDNSHCTRMVELMRIMLNNYAKISKSEMLDRTQIDLISKAAYFCDIGYMAVPSKTLRATAQGEVESDQYKKHVTLGSNIIRLNFSSKCRYFVEVCSDMCVHHHERYDGKGYPHKLVGNNNLIYTQICGLIEKFDQLFYKYREHNELQFEFVAGGLAKDKGAVSQEVFSLLTGSKTDIVKYYQKMDKL